MNMVTIELLDKRIGELVQLHAEAQQTADKYLGALEECQKIKSFIIARSESGNVKNNVVNEPLEIFDGGADIKPAH